MPDGFGYCRDFDYEPLMQKSEDELANEIIQSLTEIREKMMKIREKMINSNSQGERGGFKEAINL